MWHAQLVHGERSFEAISGSPIPESRSKSSALGLLQPYHVWSATRRVLRMPGGVPTMNLVLILILLLLIFGGGGFYYGGPMIGGGIGGVLLIVLIVYLVMGRR
jgi:hypothetical protein